jgi:hypothetical protein
MTVISNVSKAHAAPGPGIAKALAGPWAIKREILRNLFPEDIR